MRASLPTEEENLKVTAEDPTLREVTNETCGKEFSLGKESKKLKSENKSTTSPGGIWWDQVRNRWDRWPGLGRRLLGS